MSAPDQADVDKLRDLLDLMADFKSNDQRARYLLSSNWMRDRGGAAASVVPDLAPGPDLDLCRPRPRPGPCPGPVLVLKGNAS